MPNKPAPKRRRVDGSGVAAGATVAEKVPLLSKLTLLISEKV